MPLVYMIQVCKLINVVRGMQTYADCVETFILIRCTEQVQVNYKDKDKKTTFKTHSQNIHKKQQENLQEKLPKYLSRHLTIFCSNKQGLTAWILDWDLIKNKFRHSTWLGTGSVPIHTLNKSAQNYSTKFTPNLQNVMGHNTDPRAHKGYRDQSISSSMTAINAKS